MAKIRVYELARDLNMTNQALLDKIRSMNIEVKSHVSSLDDDTVAKIKTGLHSSVAVPEDVEVVRVKPTIIRKRKVVVQAEAEPKPEPPAGEPPEAPVPKSKLKEEEAPKQESVPAETYDREAAETASGAAEQQEPAKAEEAESPGEAKEIPAEQEKPPIIKTLKPVKPAKKIRRETPAKILRLPEAPKTVEPAEEKKPPVVHPVKAAPAAPAPATETVRPHIPGIKTTVEITPEMLRKPDYEKAPDKVIQKKEVSLPEKKKKKDKDKLEDELDLRRLSRLKTFTRLSRGSAKTRKAPKQRSRLPRNLK
jgi:translation initiation factor IF-2